MKLKKFTEKYYISIFFMIILIIIVAGGLVFNKKAFADQSIPLELQLSELMKSMKIYKLDNHQTAPEFSLESLNGDQVRLSDFKGNVVVLSFWATW